MAWHKYVNSNIAMQATDKNLAKKKKKMYTNFINYEHNRYN